MLQSKDVCLRDVKPRRPRTRNEATRSLRRKSVVSETAAMARPMLRYSSAAITSSVSHVTYARETAKAPRPDSEMLERCRLI